VQVVELQVEPARAQLQRQLRGKQHAAVHHRKEHRHTARVVVANLLRHARDRALQ